jgi:exopolysaccharide biosynthesis polyprenyl glycosylphosphotransferase
MTSFNFKKFLLLAGDLVVFYLVLYLALLARYQAIPDNELLAVHLTSFTFIFFFWLLIFYTTNLYDLRGAVNNSQFWRRTITAISFSGLVAALWFYLLPIGIAPKTNLAIYLAIFLLVFPLWRQFFNFSILKYLPKRKLGFIGNSPEVQELTAELNQKKHLGYEVALIMNENDPQASNLPQIIKEQNISLLIIATDLHQSKMLSDALFACLPLGLDYSSLPAFYENITGRIPINVINQTWFLENLSEGNRARFNTLKRLSDLFASTLLFILSSPIWPLIALGTKLSSPGPVYFKQVRVGKNGQEFTMIKFRTMREEGNARTLTVEGDTRITKFGNFLRKTRLDELPQLINIFKGEMSFVGPRPERPEFVVDLEKHIPFYRERLLTVPGVTGWDQVSGEYHSASVEDTIKKLQYDLYYIKNRSTYLDFTIILKTIATVFSRSGR